MVEGWKTAAFFFIFFPCNIHRRKVRNRGRKIIPSLGSVVYTHFAAIKEPSLILCMTMSIGFGALENLPLLPPSTQVSISIALLGSAKKISILCTISFQPMINSCLCSPKQQGAWPSPGVQCSWEGENGGKKGISGAWRSGIVPVWFLFLVFQALALQKHLNYYSSAVK